MQICILTVMPGYIHSYNGSLKVHCVYIEIYLEPQRGSGKNDRTLGWWGRNSSCYIELFFVVKNLGPLAALQWSDVWCYVCLSSPAKFRM